MQWLVIRTSVLFQSTLFVDRELYAQGLTNHFVVVVVFVNISLTLDYQARGQFYFTIIVHNHDFLYHMGDTLWGKRQFFSNLSFPVTDTKNLCKYHLNTYKKSIIDQNLKGIAHLKRLPRPWEV